MLSRPRVPMMTSAASVPATRARPGWTATPRRGPGSATEPSRRWANGLTSESVAAAALGEIHAAPSGDQAGCSGAAAGAEAAHAARPESTSAAAAAGAAPTASVQPSGDAARRRRRPCQLRDCFPGLRGPGAPVQPPAPALTHARAAASNAAPAAPGTFTRRRSLRSQADHRDAAPASDDRRQRPAARHASARAVPFKPTGGDGERPRVEE